MTVSPMATAATSWLRQVLVWTSNTCWLSSSARVEELLSLEGTAAR